jgi:monovalent cation/hydrogen antiporter
LRALELHDDDPVGREIQAARERALAAGLVSLRDEDSPVAEAVRQEFSAHLTRASDIPAAAGADHGHLHRRALSAARGALLGMRDSGEIGDDAFHRLEEELDWLEMAGHALD